jgi:peptide/nickel transport system ATP-binding protein
MINAMTDDEQGAEIILQTHELVRHFRSGGGLLGSATTIRAVDGVNLAVHRGETLAIVGESGCGKSTLARLMLHLLAPTSGTVIYKDIDLAQAPASQMRALRADIQFIFQDPFSSLNPRMTVGELIAEPLLVHRSLTSAQRRQRVQELLVKVGLRPDHMNRYPHEFSGGQRQRIGISRALASGPKLLIGDEPVSALDVSVQAQIINLLEDLKQEFGLTLIIIAHDLAVIRHMSDRVAVMYLGEVVEIAETESLYRHPVHPYTRALLDAVPVAMPGSTVRRQTLTGDIPSPASPPSGCRFHTRCNHATQICTTVKPILSQHTADRLVACHHWSDMRRESLHDSPMIVRSAAAEQRFDLYRQYSETPVNHL